MNPEPIVFVDFDGTITANDVGYEMFSKFTSAATEPFVTEYRNGRIDSLECLSKECDIWNRKPPPVDEVVRYVRQQPIAGGFDRFLEYLRELNIEITVLSEGFDFYIDSILESNGLADLKRITNSADYRDGRLHPRFPYFESGCGRCSNCKGYHIRKISRPEQSVVYIGDGHSDAHAADNSDIVFAKSHLEKYMVENGRGFIPFSDFHAVLGPLQDIIERGIFIIGRHLNFRRSPEGTDVIRLIVESKDGQRLGDASISWPVGTGICELALETYAEYRDDSLMEEIWRELLQASQRRLPGAGIRIAIANGDVPDAGLFEALGFRVDGGPGLSTAAIEPTDSILLARVPQE